MFNDKEESIGIVVQDIQCRLGRILEFRVISTAGMADRKDLTTAKNGRIVGVGRGIEIVEIS